MSLNAIRIILVLSLGVVMVLAGASLGHAPTRAATESAGMQEALRGLLPSETSTNGWSMAAEPEFFDAENLWEYINGQAEMYLDYGFVQVMAVDYISRGGTGFLTVEIYLMESPVHAFGIYAAERSSDESFIEIGVQGYIGENNLNFWKGPYYVKLTSFEVLPGLAETLKTLAVQIAGNVSGRYREPELFTCFPEGNRVKMSERFIPKDFMGQPFLKNGYRVDYRDGEDGYNAFLIQTASPLEAEEVFRRYLTFLEIQDQELSMTSTDTYNLIQIQKEGHVFLDGVFLGGVFGIGDPEASRKFIEELIGRLRNRARQSEKP